MQNAGSFPVVGLVLDHARVSDLVVASQTDHEWPASGWLDVADLVAVGSGQSSARDSNASRLTHIGSRVLVAWNGRREAARAVFDALPILKHAEAIKVVWIDPQSDGEPERTLAPGHLRGFAPPWV